MEFLRSLAQHLVWVPEEARESATRRQLSIAKLCRLLGLFIILVVPLAVAAATVAPSIWKAATTKTVPSSMNLLLSILLASLYAWYAGFITHLLLLGPRLERIRLQDLVLPVVLALAYLYYAWTKIRSLPEVQSSVASGTHLPKDAGAEPIVKLFLLIYFLWGLRDLLELLDVGRPHGHHAATKYVVRMIWLGVDVIQMLVAGLAIFEISLCDMEFFSLKDLAVFVAFIGWVLVYWVTKNMRDANEAQAFTAYVAALDPDGVEGKEDLSAALGASTYPYKYTLVDLGCGDGRRTKEMFDALNPKPGKIVGVDWSEASQASFEGELRSTDCVVIFKHVKRFNAKSVEALDLQGDLIVLHISHFWSVNKFARSGLKAFVKALPKAQLRCLLWRAPAPGSLSHTAAALSGGDYLAPPFTVLDVNLINEIAADLDLTAIACAPSEGRATAIFLQQLRLGNLFQVTEWLSCCVPTRIADRVEHWLRQQRSFDKVPDNDAVYAFSKIPAGSPSTNL
jgi:hypothetical protein